MLRKLVIAAVLLALLAGVAAVAWRACGMPPLRLVLKYGYPSPMGPTGRTLTIEGMEFVEISPGYFRMGSHFLCDRGDLLGRVSAAVGLSWGRQPQHGNECPVRWVEFPAGLWISRTEVTWGQYLPYRLLHPTLGEFLEVEPPPDYASHLPVFDLSWQDAAGYARWVAERSALPASLPSETEWECACRAGSTSEYCFGDDPRGLSDYAWYGQNSHGTMHLAAQTQPNAWGLMDMHGNVREWCLDDYRPSRKGSSAWSAGSTRLDPGPPQSQVQAMKSARGGGWRSDPGKCRSASRSRREIDGWSPDLGVRLTIRLPAD